MGNGVKTGNWVLVRVVLPLSLSAEADAKVLGDRPTSHNLSVWTYPYGLVRMDRSVHSQGFGYQPKCTSKPTLTFFFLLLSYGGVRRLRFSILEKSLTLIVANGKLLLMAVAAIRMSSVGMS